jgi:hypothetical protein
VTLVPLDGGEDITLEARSDQAVLAAVERALGGRRHRAWLGQATPALSLAPGLSCPTPRQDEVDDADASFRDYGIEDGARLTVTLALAPTPTPTPGSLSR